MSRKRLQRLVATVLEAAAIAILGLSLAAFFVPSTAASPFDSYDCMSYNVSTGQYECNDNLCPPWEACYYFEDNGAPHGFVCNCLTPP